MGKTGFYNLSHATSECRAHSPKSYPTQSQSDDTPTLESNFGLSQYPPCNLKWEESSDDNPDDLQWEGVYWSLVVDPNYYFYTGGVIYIFSTSEDAPLNKNNNDPTVIGYLDSFFKYFDYHNTPINMDPLNGFLDDHGYTCSSLKLNLDSKTIDVYSLDKILDTCESPFYSVHIPSGSTISFCEQYPWPSSICQTRVNDFLCQIIYD